MLATVSTVMAATTVNVAVPAIMRAFAIGQDEVQWLSTGFLAAATATMLTTAWWVRAHGQRFTYLAAIALFVAGTGAAALAPALWVLIAGRLAQGAASGILQPLAMITLFQVFPEEERGRAMGIYGLGIVLAPALGPALGGFLVDHYGWPAVFLLSLPFCLVAAVLLPRYIPAHPPGNPRPAFDRAGFALLIAALACLLAGLSRLHERVDAATLALLAGAAAAGAAFVRWELARGEALIDLRIFAEGRFVAAALVSFAYGVGIFGSIYLAPIYVQEVLHYSPGRAGLLLIPGGIVLAIVMPLAGRLADVYSSHHVVMAGMACFSASFVLFALGTGVDDFAVLATWIVIGRIGLGLVIPGQSAGAMRAAPRAYAHHVPGAISFARQLGGAMGVNLLAIFLEARTLAACAAAPCARAYRDSFYALAAVFALALIPAWLMGRRRG